MNKPAHSTPIVVRAGMIFCFLLATTSVPAAPPESSPTTTDSQPTPPAIEPSAPVEKPSPAPPPANPASPLAGWRRLRFGATKFLIGSARSTVERWAAGEGGAEALVRVTTSMGYFGHEARLHHAYSVLSAAGGLPAHWMELDPGKSARETTVSKDGSLSLRRFGPPPGKAPPWPGAWTEGRTDKATAKMHVQGGPCGGPLDAWLLLARLDCLTAAEEVRFVLLSNDGGHEVIARRSAARRTTISVSNLDDGARANMVLDQWRVELLPGPGEPDPSFFGMDSGVILWIDAGSGAPVEISGGAAGWA